MAKYTVNVLYLRLALAQPFVVERESAVEYAPLAAELAPETFV